MTSYCFSPATVNGLHTVAEDVGFAPAVASIFALGDSRDEPAPRVTGAVR